MKFYHRLLCMLMTICMLAGMLPATANATTSTASSTASSTAASMAASTEYVVVNENQDNPATLTTNRVVYSPDHAAQDQEAAYQDGHVALPVITVTGENKKLHTNGLREGKIGSVNVRQVRLAAASASEYLSEKEAIASLREQMVARSENLQVKVVSNAPANEAEVNDFVSKLFEAALEHTGEPKEGDYLKFQYRGWSVDGGYDREGDTAYYTLTYSVIYYTNAEQEAAVDAAVADLLVDLDLDGKTEFEKIKAIYDHITSTVTYDYAGLENNNDWLKYTAYGALIKNNCVCQGYANLFYRLALEVGIDARIIAGTSQDQNHAWNIVKLGDVYYNLDSTWDAGVQDYKYFLKNESNFADHTRNAEYDTDAFHAAYPMAVSNYGEEDLWSSHIADKFSGGDGSEQSPFLIASAEELALMASRINTDFEGANTAFYKLTADIDLSGYEWVPINYFCGVLDGDNHTISGLTITQVNELASGFILYAEQATIKNLKMKDVAIRIDTTAGDSFYSTTIGSLVGTGYPATIENCEVDGNVNIHFVGGGIHFGFLAGVLKEGSTVTNSHTSGAVTARNEKGPVCVGGLTASLSGNSAVYTSSFSGIFDIYSNNAMYDAIDADGWAVNVGGLVGDMYGGVLKDSYAAVTADVETTAYGIALGGAVGRISFMPDISFRMENVYSVSEMHHSGFGITDTYCGLFYGGVDYDAANHKFTDDLNIHTLDGNHVIIENCGHFAHDTFINYQNIDFVGDVNILFDTYSIMDTSVQELFTEAMDYDASVWDIRNGYYPVLKGQEPKAIPSAFTHIFEDYVCVACASVDKTVTVSGTHGDNITWKIENGVLTLSGDGSVHYVDTSTGNKYPWSDYGFDMVIVEEGINSLRYAGNAFAKCNSLRKVVLPHSLEAINPSAFDLCSGLTEFTIPRNACIDTDNIFGDCKNLKNIIVEEGNPYYCSADGVLYSADMKTLLSVSKRWSGEMYVPEGVETIGSFGSSAFGNCRYVSAVHLPDSVKNIESSAFNNCYFRSITLPESLEVIKSRAFYYHTLLQEIVIPASVQVIGEGAFEGCYGLSLIRFEGPVPEIAADAFNYVEATAFYPAEDESWTSAVMQGYGGTLDWQPFYTYEILEGEDVELAHDNEEPLVIRTAGEISKFEGVTVNGELVDPSNYTVTEGSTIITFTPEYLQTLKAGKFTIAIHFADGISETNLTIKPEHLLGDVTGDGQVTAADYSRLLAHVKKTNLITDEATLLAADVTGDGQITAADYSRLLAHVKKTNPLW